MKMRNAILITVVILVCSACDVSDNMTTQSGSSTPNPRALAAKGGCMGCHTVYNSVYGPAWKMVSERYQGVPDAQARLVKHINEGSAGRWDHITGGKRMPPQEGALNDAELKVVIDYILALATPEPPTGTTPK